MKFSLWDTETSNQFGSYEDEREVLILVRTLVSRYGETYAEELVLGRVDDEGMVLQPLTGATLLSRANEILGDCHREDEEEQKGEVIGGRFAVARNLLKRADDIFGNRRIGRVMHASGQQRHR